MVRTYLVEGVSGNGKTSVCRELDRRGDHAVDGDVPQSGVVIDATPPLAVVVDEILGRTGLIRGGTT